MTSYRDIFSQDFAPVDKSRVVDKTCSSGLGSDDIGLSVDAVNTGLRWLNEAGNRKIKMTSSKINVVTKREDILQTSRGLIISLDVVFLFSCDRIFSLTL